MIASLPMYDWPELRHATDAFWELIAEHLRKSGLNAPEGLTRASDASDHWLREDLLFSQTCGYPFATKLIGKVQLVGTPHYGVEGCEGPTYRSAVIVRKDAFYADMGETSDAKFAYNSLDSLSGFRCMGPLVGKPLAWFADRIVSGGHRNSALMVTRGDADIAAIDAVCWDYFQRFEPEAAAELRVLAWGEAYPALPFIMGSEYSNVEIAALREALALAIHQMRVSYNEIHLKIENFSIIKENEYRFVAAL